MTSQRVILGMVAMLSMSLVMWTQSTSAEACSYVPGVDCVQYIMYAEAPECLIFIDDNNSTDGYCHYGMSIENSCNRKMDVLFFCHDQEDYCPDDVSLDPGDETYVPLGYATLADELAQIDFAIVDYEEVDNGVDDEQTESEPGGFISRTISETDPDAPIDCSMEGCSAAPSNAPGSATVMLFLFFIGTLVLRCRTKD